MNCSKRESSISKNSRNGISCGMSGLFLAATLCVIIAPIAAQAPSLGVADSFAVLAGSAVTDAGASVITGDLGVSPGTSVTGFPPGIVNGTMHVADAVAQQAQADLGTAFGVLAGAACNVNLTGQDLGGLTLLAGVYCFSSSAGLTGTLTLDAQGNPNAEFIFQIGSTLIAEVNSTVRMINGGRPCNVFWQVGSSATLGTSSVFVGNILAQASITLGVGTGVTGRVLARTGAVTVDSSTVSKSIDCGCGPARVTEIGPGCGTPPPALAAVGLPTIPNPGFGFTVMTNPNAQLFLLVSSESGNLSVGSGCTLWLGVPPLMHMVMMSDPSGFASASVAVPNLPELDGLVLNWQVVELREGGPVMDKFVISNALQLCISLT